MVLGMAGAIRKDAHTASDVSSTAMSIYCV
jgi:hypothetical protein